ncbi:MAG: NADPH-dependent F420 reductase [Deltaproteobacteria bacterium]|nr:NADPH-dependent F420 reductase [Deltaproteobacteria bacterium]MCB9490004.1 NADPH-dependent F420 reductase [Deltaproteobacteria bacterium]
MDIAIIGAGNVGGTLGRKFAAKGHNVTFAVRLPDSEKTKTLLADFPDKVRALTIPKATTLADVILLATPWDATREALQAAGDLSGKVLIDCTNPLADGMRGLALGHSTSGAEQIAEWASGAKVVKAFNSTGSGNMDNPVYDGASLTMFYCGDDGEAKETARQLIADTGFEPVDAGVLAAARYLEPLAMLWIHLAYVKGLGPDIAMRLVTR